jgi:hypothetical protein
MSYQKKLDSAIALIEEHNSKSSVKVNVIEFKEKLITLGGTTEDLLKEMKFEDIGDNNVPVLLARRIARIFRTDISKDEDIDDGSGRVVSLKKADQMTYRDLLGNYNPADPESYVGKRLKRLSQGQPFIVYDNTGKVIVEQSFDLLTDVINGRPGIDTIMLSDIPWAVYRVGERPNHYFDENPLIPGSPLRSGETCEETKESWKDIELEVRQLLRLAVLSGEVDKKDFFDIIIRARGMKNAENDAFVFFSRKYKSAALKFKDLQDLGQLPTLKMKSTFHTNKSKANSPFYLYQHTVS